MKGRAVGGVLALGLLAAGVLASLHRPAARAQSAGGAGVLRGARLYNVACLSCHGPDGDGRGPAPAPAVSPPALDALDRSRWPTSRVAAVIRSGSLPMPRFGEVLSPAQIHNLAVYVRSLKPPPERRP